MYFNKDKFQFTKRELFKLSDGGCLYIDQLGKFDGTRPLLFVLPGIQSGVKGDVHHPAQKNIFKEAQTRGLDCAQINYRGMAGAPLTSAKWYCNGSTQDMTEAILYLTEKYQPPKKYALGNSLGGSILAQLNHI